MLLVLDGLTLSQMESTVRLQPQGFYSFCLFVYFCFGVRGEYFSIQQEETFFFFSEFDTVTCKIKRGQAEI